jgi:hypothetical protein
MFCEFHGGNKMTKKAKQSKKTAKNSKRTEVAEKPEDEIDTDNMCAPIEVPQATPAIPQGNVPEVHVESQQADAVTTEAAGSETAPKTTRSETAKANIKEGLKQHALAGRPTKAQPIFVFGTKGYAMTWPKRTEKFGITPETFQAALAKGVPAIRLGPGAQTVVEKTKGTV